MKLPVIDELRRESIPEAPQWMDSILYVINRFIRNVYQVMMGNISIDDNLNEEKIELEISTNDIPSDGYKVKLRKFKGIPFGCIVCQNRFKTESAHTIISDGQSVDWIYENGFLKIYEISGLTSAIHVVRLRVF